MTTVSMGSGLRFHAVVSRAFAHECIGFRPYDAHVWMRKEAPKVTYAMVIRNLKAAGVMQLSRLHGSFGRMEIDPVLPK
jgi:hypothetical protein